MSTESSSFSLLDERIQHYIWKEGWETLRDAQEAAIPLIIKADRDVIVSAATAAGKTEAAFLPALTHLLQADKPGLIVYISPLKALINDQFGRLEKLCEDLDIPVWPWHGDISSSSKAKFLKLRHGVLLITPESMEAMLCNRGTSIRAIFSRLRFFVIDELHAFIGSERGKQLQSLMHRIELVMGRSAPRIGLSATLGNMNLAADFLRPGGGRDVAMVVSKSAGSELKVLLKGYIEPLVRRTVKPEAVDDAEADITPEPSKPIEVARHLFKSLRGTNNLIFPNSRREVERYTHLLGQLCEEAQVPNEFWPHHGSLSKEIRAETEAALKQKERPASAICTNTLELGIDIGAVKSVAQIGPPPSVASLRQRLGRSGRRKGEAAILRGYCIEDEVNEKSSLRDELRLDTVQMIAMVSLLVEGWFEPPVTEGAHLSTLIMQMMSFIAQNGGATIGQLYSTLNNAKAPFAGITKEQYVELVRHLGERELLMQESGGVLLHAPLGEKFVNHYSFYAAFATDEEFRIVCNGKVLGTLPVSQLLTPGQRILFAGKTWIVESIDEAQKTIYVARARGGTPPLFSGGSGVTHTKVRQRIRELLQSADVPAYLDDIAQQLLREGRAAYVARQLDQKTVVDLGDQVQIMTWLGDASNEGVACLLQHRGYVAVPSGPGVEVLKSDRTTENIIDAIVDIGQSDLPALDDLLIDASNLQREKWDWALPDSLLRISFASLHLDLEEAVHWAKTVRSAMSVPTSDLSPST